MRIKVLSLSIAIVTALAGPAIAQTFQLGPMKFRRAFFATADRGNIEWIVADGEVPSRIWLEFVWRNLRYDEVI